MTENPKRKTFVVNLLAGPGSGKSTLAASIFSELKWRDIECELATEYAKDLVWEKRSETFKNQIYIFGKQHHRISRLIGQVDVVIVDSPLLLTLIYDSERRPELERLVIVEYNKMTNINFFINRTKPYHQVGRNQDESGAKKKDQEIINFLSKHKIPCYCVDGNREGLDFMIQKILDWLSGENWVDSTYIVM